MERIETLIVGDVPLVLRSPQQEHTPAPLIVLWHGFGPPGTEQALSQAVPLHGLHAYKAYLGLPFFGSRLPAGGLEELRRRQASDYILDLFVPMAEAAMCELPAVIDHLCRRFPVQRENGIGIFGFSAGGMATLLTMAEAELRIAAAVVCNSPTSLSAPVRTLPHYVWTPESTKAAQRFDMISRTSDLVRVSLPPALLLLQGAKDEYFSQNEILALHRELHPLYQELGAPERVNVE